LPRAGLGKEMDLWKIPTELRTEKSEAAGLDFEAISFHNASTGPRMR
jgi:hypothetical protein